MEYYDAINIFGQQEIKERKPEIEKEIYINNSDELILSILKTASKTKAERIKPNFDKKNNYEFDLGLRKYIVLLNNSKIFACNDEAIILVHDRPRAINEMEANIQIYKFLRDTLDLDFHVIAISSDDRLRIIDKFKSYSNRNDIPDIPLKKHIIIEPTEEELEQDFINKISKFFGMEVETVE